MNIETYGCLQLCLCLANSKDSHGARLYRFEKKNGEWALLDEHAAVIGKKGITWNKREGDMKTPAGVFKIGSVFGFEQVRLQMPYIQLVKGCEGVDDPKSQHYNKIMFNASNKDWSSSEDMMCPLYKWGIVVEHNTSPAIPYLGSCIFYHIWRSAEEGTAGCTAMEEDKLKNLIYWLDPEKKPLMVQLPQEEYSKMAPTWGLPSL